jgi:hypothetical protein
MWAKLLAILKRVKELWGWLGFIGQIAVFFGFAGIFVSIGGAIWAALTGVPLPIVLMVGYCTLVGAVYLTLAPFLYRLVSQAGIEEIRQPESKPHYEAWRHVHELSVRQAAFLWCDVEPSRVDMPPKCRRGQVPSEVRFRKVN